MSEKQTPGLMQRIIARLRSKPKDSVEERAAKAKAGAENLVRNISDTSTPGIIQRRRQLYDDIDAATKE